jgi:hypothetical protein
MIRASRPHRRVARRAAGALEGRETMDRIDTLSLESETSVPQQKEELVVIAIIGVLIGLLNPTIHF